MPLPSLFSQGALFILCLGLSKGDGESKVTDIKSKKNNEQRNHLDLQYCGTLSFPGAITGHVLLRFNGQGLDEVVGRNN